METITRINGNGKEYTTDLPKLVIIGKMNDAGLAHIRENTGLQFAANWLGFEAQPYESKQIAALLMTYNFKSRYYNNASHKNTLMLKSDHHQGFDVDSICFDCVKHNHINISGLEQGDRLAC